MVRLSGRRDVFGILLLYGEFSTTIRCRDGHESPTRFGLTDAIDWRMRRPPDRGGGSRCLAAEQRGAGFQKFLRIDRFAVDAGLVMQMRAGRAPGRAQASDHLADANALPNLDVDFRQMAVTGGKAVAVIDLDHL